MAKEHIDINDDIIINECFQSNCGRLKRHFNFDDLNEDIKKYILHRYNDSLSIEETLKRIYYKIDVHPKCPICGNLVTWGACGNNKFFHDTCSLSCAGKLSLITIKNKYGYNNPMEFPHAKENLENTMLKKYGVKHVLQNKEIKKKQEQTCIDRFGTNNVFSSEYGKQKIKKSLIKHFGVDHQMKCKEVKNKFNWITSVAKQIETKRKNNSFNTSKPEVESFNLLKEKYPDVINQYKDERYPFACDFYIPSLDLYIECNYHWTHGGHPYNENNKEDQLLLEKWKTHNAKFYKVAINTWTIRDVNKRNLAKQNNINYLEIWNINELKNWINKFN